MVKSSKKTSSEYQTDDAADTEEQRSEDQQENGKKRAGKRAASGKAGKSSEISASKKGRRKSQPSSEEGADEQEAQERGLEESESRYSRGRSEEGAYPSYDQDREHYGRGERRQGTRRYEDAQYASERGYPGGGRGYYPRSGREEYGSREYEPSYAGGSREQREYQGYRGGSPYGQEGYGRHEENYPRRGSRSSGWGQDYAQGSRMPRQQWGEGGYGYPQEDYRRYGSNENYPPEEAYEPVSRRGSIQSDWYGETSQEHGSRMPRQEQSYGQEYSNDDYSNRQRYKRSSSKR